MGVSNSILSVAKFVAVVDGFILALQLLPYGAWDGAPGVANIDGWQAVMVAIFIISIVYLWYRDHEEIDELKRQLKYYETKNKN
ncbi:hypothetical protein HYW35_02665 [Candidatus Saccharibacteria bacterium]|nr:hypothetical protein [Candidatus Saccharibacteria bacterium]